MEPTMVPLEGVFGWVLGIAGFILNLFFITYAAADIGGEKPMTYLMIGIGVVSIALVIIGSGLVTAYDILHYMG